MRSGSESIHIGDIEIQVHFPDASDIRRHIRSILSGKEYPVLGATFAPEFIIDVGANVGAAALSFASAYPAATVLCFEPSPSTFRFLEANTAPISRIRVFNVGLSDNDARVPLYLGRLHCLQHSIVQHSGLTEEYEMVEIRRASQYLKNLVRGTCLLKIDAEGCEVPVLRDLKEALALTDIVYVEYHSEEDRLNIDGLLRSSFKLWRSTAEVVHRGNLAYLSRRLLARLPDLESNELPRPS